MANQYARSNNTALKQARFAAPAAVVALATTAIATPGWAGDNKPKPKQVPFEDVSLIIEFNATDEDVGVQFFLDVDSWKAVQVFSPRGKKIFEARATANLLRQGGGTELFLESAEPTLDELPLEEFFEQFPEGVYHFTGRTIDGDILVGATEFTHDIPAGPQILLPTPAANKGCSLNVPLPVVIAWNDVTTSIEGKPIDVAEYEVIVGENTFDVHLEGTMVTVPSELLKPGTRYGFEILAIEEGGNQTITESCFVTAT